MPFQTENTTSYTFQDEQEASGAKDGGEPIGLLLTLTYPQDTGYTVQTENSITYTFQTENTTDYA